MKSYHRTTINKVNPQRNEEVLGSIDISILSSFCSLAVERAPLTYLIEIRKHLQLLSASLLSAITIAHLGKENKDTDIDEQLKQAAYAYDDMLKLIDDTRKTEKDDKDESDNAH